MKAVANSSKNLSEQVDQERLEACSTKMIAVGNTQRLAEKKLYFYLFYILHFRT